MKNRSYHHGNLAEELILKAKKIFLEEDVNAVTIRRITKELEVSPMAFYSHFSGLDELLNGLARIYLHELENLSTVAMKNEPDPLERFYKLGETYIFYANDKPKEFLMMFRSEPGSPLNLDWNNTVLYRTLIKAVVDIYPPNTQQEKIQIKAISAWSLVHGMAMLLSRGPLQDISKDKKTTRLLISQVVRNIKLD